MEEIEMKQVTHAQASPSLEFLGRAKYVALVVAAYKALPGTVGCVRTTDRKTAGEMYDRGIPILVVENALVLAALRRLVRPTEVPALGIVRSLAYFLPVIDEVLAMEVGQEYFQYARQKLRRITRNS